MNSLKIILLSSLLSVSLIAQPIYFEREVLVDTTTIDLLAQDSPDFDIDGDGNLYIVWTEELEYYPIPFRYYIVSILSSDGGESFYAKNFVGDGPLPKHRFGGYRSRTKIALDKNGNPMVGWLEVSDYLQSGWINFSKSSDGGLTYPPDHLIIFDQDATYDMLFADNNTFYLTWRDGNENSILLGISDDGGISFDTVTTVVDYAAIGWGFNPGWLNLTVDYHQTVSVFWSSSSPLTKRWLSRSYNGGLNFAPPDTFLNFPYKQLSSEVVVVDGEYFILFWGFIDQHNHHIYFSRSINGGREFTDPVLMGENLGYDINYHPLTGLLVRIGSNIYRSWDFGDTFADTAFVRSDSGQQVYPYKLMIDPQGIVYTIGTKVNLDNLEKRWVVLNKTDRLVSIEKPTVNPQRPSFNLRQNYPNPFNGQTTIGYKTPINAVLSIKLYNSLGQEVATLINGYHSAGNHELRFTATELGSGFYTYVLRANGQVQARRMLHVK